MIRLVDAPPDRRRELAVVGGAPVSTVAQTASALRPALIARFSEQLATVGRRWGIDAASSLFASLGAAAESETYLVRVLEFGPALAWVELGEGMMRPLTLESWFSFDRTWSWLAPRAGLQRLLRDNADAVLAGEPRQVIAALRAAAPELKCSGEPRVDVAQRTISFDEARYHGCVGPGTLDLNDGTFTLHTQRVEPWQPRWEE